MEKDSNILDIIIDKWVVMNLEQGCKDLFLIHDDVIDEIIQKKITIKETEKELIALIRAKINSYEIKVVNKNGT